MIEILSLYLLLYERLKTEGLAYLVEQEPLSEGPKKALRALARLPRPVTATLEEVESTCQKVRRGELEVLSPIANIGDCAGKLLELCLDLQEGAEPDYSLDSLAHDSVEPINMSLIVNWNNNLLLSMNANLQKLNRQLDLNLKGRCPFCSGDLVQVIFDPGKGQPLELRLRCYQQAKPDCRGVDWFIQTLDKRNP